jgi:hypothetical protein
MRFLLGVLALCFVAGCGSVHTKSNPDAATTPDAPAAVCTANAMSCGSDNAVYQCDMDGAQETKVQDCQYGCTTDHCNECMANTTFCNGDDLAMCSSDGAITNPMTCQFGCQNDACNACMPNTTYCSGSMAVTCDASGQPGNMQNCGTAGCNGGVCNTCTPNTTTCQGDTLVVCNSGGTVASTTSCALGCSTTGSTHCKALVPSFGVPAPSGTLPALTISDNATLDISGCASLNVLLTIGSTTTAIPASQLAVVSQSSGPPICVVKYGSITIDSPYTLTVVNSASPGHMLSLDTTGDFSLSGKIVFSNAADGPTPGGTVFTVGNNANSFYMAPGAGGGGGVRAGGTGGTCVACGGTNYPGGAGGGVVTNFATMLSGGSAGGNVYNASTITAYGGRGGGGIQIVSLTRVTIAASAVIDLNGGGGTGPIKGYGGLTAGGGGAGGQLLVEAPTVSVSAGAIAVANGGGGAGGDYYGVVVNGFPRFYHYNGEPGQLSASRAAGGDIPNTTNGDGGYEANGDTAPSANGSPSDSGAATYGGGGGGGSQGFITLHGRGASSVMIAFGAVISPAPATGAVTAQ